MAVGRSGEFLELIQTPLAGLFALYGDIERWFTLRAAEDCGTSEQAPLETAQPASDRVASESHHTHVGRKIHGRRVLVVDDNPVNHMVARAILTNAGCTAKALTNGQDAVDLLRAAPLAYDLELMDMQMPGIDGPTATRAIRAAGLTALPVIALTGNSDEADRQLCLAAGMNDFPPNRSRPGRCWS